MGCPHRDLTAETAASWVQGLAQELRVEAIREWRRGDQATAVKTASAATTMMPLGLPRLKRMITEWVRRPLPGAASPRAAAQLEMDRGDWSRGILWLINYLEDPSSPPDIMERSAVHRDLSHCFAQLGAFERALVHAMTAKRLNPSDPALTHAAEHLAYLDFAQRDPPGIPERRGGGRGGGGGGGGGGQGRAGGASGVDGGADGGADTDRAKTHSRSHSDSHSRSHSRSQQGLFRDDDLDRLMGGLFRDTRLPPVPSRADPGISTNDLNTMLGALQVRPRRGTERGHRNGGTERGHREGVCVCAPRRVKAGLTWLGECLPHSLHSLYFRSTR